MKIMFAAKNILEKPHGVNLFSAISGLLSLVFDIPIPHVSKAKDILVFQHEKSRL